MDVRDYSPVCTVRSIHEEGESCNKSKHERLAPGICEPNCQTHGALRTTAEDQPKLLGLHALGAVVEEIRHCAASRSADQIEEPEHRCPSSGVGLSEMREVIQIVCAENRVDCEFTAEGTSIGRTEHEALQAEDDTDGLLDRGLADDFALDSALVVLTRAVVFLTLDVLLQGAFARTGCSEHDGYIGEFASNINDFPIGSCVRANLVDGVIAVRPRAGRGVFAQKDHAECENNDEDERDYEGDSPGLVGCQPAIVNERIKDSRHHEAIFRISRTIRHGTVFTSLKRTK